jgi:cellulose synthase/poly-beta-1,6-N-acetylglucosamine synthase-like glycosyltransferase
VPSQPIRQVYRSRVHAKLWVIDKQNGGKADALNAGINFSRTPLVCCVDADSMLDARALVHLVEPFIYGDGRVLVTGGTVRVINGAKVRDGKICAVSIPRVMIVRLQMLEYLRAFLFARLALNRLGGNLIISGAMGLFQRQTLVEVGGYQVGCIGEDMELIVRIHRHMRRLRRPYRVTFVPEPTCYTLAPESFEVLGKQRDRWQRGLADSLWRHRGMLFNPRYGVVGMVTLPIFFLFELISPVVELLGYLWMLLAVLDGRIGPYVGVLFYGVACLLSVLFSMQALAMDETTFAHYPALSARLRILGAALLENLGYRQFVLLSRTRGLLQFVRGGKAWGDMKRRALSA